MAEQEAGGSRADGGKGGVEEEQEDRQQAGCGTGSAVEGVARQCASFQALFIGFFFLVLPPTVARSTRLQLAAVGHKKCVA